MTIVGAPPNLDDELLANGRFLGMCRSAVVAAPLVGGAIAFCVVAWLSKAGAQGADGAPPPRPTVSNTAPAASPLEDARTDKKCAPQQTCKAGVLMVTSLGPITIAEGSNAGETSLELRNTGCAKLEGLLCAGEFVSTSQAQRLDARATFQPFPTLRVDAPQPPAEESPKATGAAPNVGQEPPAGCRLVTLDCGARLSLKVNASGSWDAAEAAAALLFEGEPVYALGNAQPAQLMVRRRAVPFNLKVATVSDSATPLSKVMGKPLSIVLQNDDALTYPVKWRLLVRGAEASPLQPWQLAPGENPLPLNLPDDLLPNPFEGLFRPNVFNATLAVEFVAPRNGPTLAPPRSFNLVLALSRHDPVFCQWFRAITTFILLILGGLFSLFLNHGIPNALRRFALHRQLEPLAALTKRLSAHVSGALRVELRMQRLQLSRRVQREPAIFPGSIEVYEQARRDAELLSRRVVLASAVDERLLRIDRMGSSGPPEFLHTQKRRLSGCLRALASLKPADAALAAVESVLANVDANLDLVEAEDEALRKTIEDETKQFWETHFLPIWERLPKEPAWAMALKQAMGGFVAHAAHCLKADHVADETLATLGTAYAKLKIMLDYVRVCESATKEKTKRFDERGLIDDERCAGQGPTQRQRFFECLSGAGMRTLEEARTLLREAEQGIYVRHIVEQVESGKFELTFLPQAILPYDPVSFSLEFYEDKFNEAVAKDKLNCIWTFKSMPAAASASTWSRKLEEAPRQENCWSPTHFFSREGQQQVSVEVKNGPYPHQPMPLPDKPDKPSASLDLKLEVQPLPDRGISHRTWLEAFQLGMALVVTMGALVAGARDQIQKLDLATAFAALFALGFGADTLKNLIGRRPNSDAESSRAA